ncbi:MAG: alpha/beta family hydrolase [Aestuariibacter sp.]
MINLNDTAQATSPKVAANVILAHGAGNDQYSEFMQSCKLVFAEQGIHCHLFDFPYMEKARALGKRRPPDKMDRLIDSFQQEIAKFIDSDLPLFIGGKSMGGRVASMILEESEVQGGICFGYPFHPPGKPEKTRTEHLKELQKPLCIVQGQRDPFGKPEEIASYCLSDAVQVHILEQGDHSFTTPKKSQISSVQNIQRAVALAADFIRTKLGVL